jgi:hypothetical protein
MLYANSAPFYYNGLEHLQVLESGGGGSLNLFPMDIEK